MNMVCPKAFLRNADVLDDGKRHYRARLRKAEVRRFARTIISRWSTRAESELRRHTGIIRIRFIRIERALMTKYRVIRSWTTEEDEILVALLKQEHQSLRAIARKLHRTSNAVRGRALKLGLSATRAERAKLASEAA
jgi:hypothetical protein